MVRERKTKVAERVISLLLAAVMAVSGTGFTALAADIVPDETVSEVETVPSEESAGADMYWPSSLRSCATVSHPLLLWTSAFMMHPAMKLSRRPPCMSASAPMPLLRSKNRA